MGKGDRKRYEVGGVSGLLNEDETIDSGLIDLFKKKKMEKRQPRPLPVTESPAPKKSKIEMPASNRRPDGSINHQGNSKAKSGTSTSTKTDSTKHATGSTKHSVPSKSSRPPTVSKSGLKRTLSTQSHGAGSQGAASKKQRTGPGQTPSSNRPKEQLAGKRGAEEKGSEDAVGDPEKPTDREKQRKHRKLKAATAKDKPERTIFVGNVSASTDKKTLKDMFKKFGRIESTRFRSLMRADLSQPRKAAAIKHELHESCKSVNAYIVFKEITAAQKALSCNNEVLDGFHLRVDAADRKSAKLNYKTSVFVGNLPFDVSEEDLRDTFQSCGKVENVRLIRDKTTRLGKGFGYIQFESVDGVFLALKLNEQEKIAGKSVRVKRCVKKVKKKKEIVGGNPSKGGRSGDKFGGKPGGKSGGKPGGKSGGKPGGKFGRKTGGKFGGKPGGKFGGKPGGKFGGKPGSKSPKRVNSEGGSSGTPKRSQDDKPYKKDSSARSSVKSPFGKGGSTDGKKTFGSGGDKMKRAKFGDKPHIGGPKKGMSSKGKPFTKGKSAKIGGKSKGMRSKKGAKH